MKWYYVWAIKYAAKKILQYLKGKEDAWAKALAAVIEELLKQLGWYEEAKKAGKVK